MTRTLQDVYSDVYNTNIKIAHFAQEQDMIALAIRYPGDTYKDQVHEFNRISDELCKLLVSIILLEKEFVWVAAERSDEENEVIQNWKAIKNGIEKKHGVIGPAPIVRKIKEVDENQKIVYDEITIDISQKNQSKVDLN